MPRATAGRKSSSTTSRAGSLDQVLPNLLERTLQRGWRAVVQVGTPERVEALDALLWTYADDSFLPHGSAKDGHPARQPIYLTNGDDNPNGAAVRFLVDGAVAAAFSGYARLVYIFDGRDPTPSPRPAKPGSAPSRGRPPDLLAAGCERRLGAEGLMNYRHAFHAGNFADVLKHAVLARIVTHLKQKETPFRVIDNARGIARYDLAGDEASRTGEWRDGIGRLLGDDADPLPADVAAVLAPYLGVVRDLNGGGGALRIYPGSPLVRAATDAFRRIASSSNELHPAIIVPSPASSPRIARPR